MSAHTPAADGTLAPTEFYPERIDSDDARFVQVFHAYDGTVIKVGHGTIMVIRPEGDELATLNADGHHTQELEYIRPTPGVDAKVGDTVRVDDGSGRVFVVAAIGENGAAYGRAEDGGLYGAFYPTARVGTEDGDGYTVTRRA